MTLGEIEKLSAEYEDAKRSLDMLVEEIKDRTSELKREFTPRLKALMGKIAKKHETLYRTVAENRDLFEKPRTQIFGTITVGLRKGKGKVQIEDEEITISLIRKYLPKKADILIRTLYEPVKSTISKLPDDELNLIQVDIVGQVDRVVIESVDTTVGKILNSLIKVQIEDLTEEYEEAA